jgi:hypothetical protein
MHVEIGAPLAVRVIRYIAGVQVFTAILAVPVAIYMASVGVSDFHIGFLKGPGYDAPAQFGFAESEPHNNVAVGIVRMDIANSTEWIPERMG